MCYPSPQMEKRLWYRIIVALSFENDFSTYKSISKTTSVSLVERCVK